MKHTTMKHLAVTLGLFSAAACTDATGPQASFPDKLVPVTTATLEGEPGFTLAEPVVVKVVGTQGRGVAGQSVTFAVTSGGGAVTPATATTDSAGIARAEWTLGPTPGENELRATASDLNSVTFRATAKEGPGGTLLRVSGGGTGILPGGCPVQNPLVVRVVDAGGRPVSNARIEFVVDAGGGKVTPDVVRTDASGEARAAWNTAGEGGVNTARAVLRTTARPSVSFSAESTPAAPGGFSTIGNKIYSGVTCTQHLFHRLSRAEHP